jgi:hypothetical protein
MSTCASPRRLPRTWTISASEKCSVSRQVLYDRFGRLLVKSDFYEIFCSHDVKGRLDSCVMEYNQKIIVKFLANESVDTDEIHTRLITQFGKQTSALRRIQFSVPPSGSTASWRPGLVWSCCVGSWPTHLVATWPGLIMPRLQLVVPARGGRIWLGSATWSQPNLALSHHCGRAFLTPLLPTAVPHPACRRTVRRADRLRLAAPTRMRTNQIGCHLGVAVPRIL